MKKRLLQWAVAALIASAALTARAQVLRSPISIRLPPIVFLPVTWKCVHANGQACAAGELTNPWVKQVFLTSAGFAELVTVSPTLLRRTSFTPVMR